MYAYRLCFSLSLSLMRLLFSSHSFSSIAHSEHILYTVQFSPPRSSPRLPNITNNNSNNDKNPLGHSNDCRLEQANNIPFQSHFIRMFSPRILLLSTYHMLHSVCSSSEWLHQRAVQSTVYTYIILAILAIKRVARLYNIYEHLCFVYIHTSTCINTYTVFP